jgi:5-methylcytosine-specific restriction endonuclease McrA
MSHVYQPIMMREILKRRGRASREDIARAILSEDKSQIEYYEEITGRMPGPVLSRHKIVEKDGRDYRLVDRLVGLTNDERADLIDLCSRKLQEYVEKRGTAPWEHRRRSAGYIPGSLRYEIIRRAAGRCEACGISVEERALEVDHIIPRNKGGSDDPTNLQALCYVCNSQKRDRDETNFAEVKRSYSDRNAVIRIVLQDAPSARSVQKG